MHVMGERLVVKTISGNQAGRLNYASKASSVVDP